MIRVTICGITNAATPSPLSNVVPSPRFQFYSKSPVIPEAKPQKSGHKLPKKVDASAFSSRTTADVAALFTLLKLDAVPASWRRIS